MWVVFFLLIGTVASFPTTYDDTYARLMIRVNSAVFSSDPANCFKNVAGFGQNWTLVSTRETSCSTTPSLQATCKYMILKNDVVKQYIIAFRGSVGSDQITAQFLSVSLVRFEKYGSVNGYYRTAFNILWPTIKPEIATAKTNGYSIVVVGHSLGGALGTMTALKIVDEGHQTADKTYLLTFGAPRVGNSVFSDYVDRTVRYRHRVVNKADTISQLPPCFSFDGVVCLKMWGYFHSQQEIWYPNGSDLGATFVTTSRNEDPHGSNSLSQYNLDDHIRYFGIGDPAVFAINNNCVG